MRRQSLIRRRRAAVVALLVWLLGLEVLPNAHVADHNYAHDHGEIAAPGTPTIIVHSLTSGLHSHGAELHHHSLSLHDSLLRKLAPAGNQVELAAQLTDPPEQPVGVLHGAGSLAHRCFDFPFSGVIALLPRVELVDELPSPFAVDQLISLPFVATKFATGPPIAPLTA